MPRKPPSVDGEELKQAEFSAPYLAPVGFSTGLAAISTIIPLVMGSA
jgi:hypothetical protein